MGSVVVKDLIKKYDDVVALKNVNLDIKEGEFFALLGPSGCGKTTTMRCIAGFEDPSSGDIFIGDQKVNHVPPNKRNCGMVFQSYALFPHYNVFENVAYSLVVRELYNGGLMTKIKNFALLMSRRLAKPSEHIEKKVRDALKYVELEPYAERAVSELSGGQQQRVALARALVMEPSVLLMDEPLSNLDKKLRNTMRSTIRRIQQDVGITTIFVTHDQEEAMSMADRVAVMKDGEVIQIASPTELYSQPKTSFVADFVGSSNIFQGNVKKSEKTHTIVKFGDIVLKSNFNTNKNDVNVMIRPESIELFANGASTDGENVIEGEVIISTYLGSQIRYDVKVGMYEFMVDKTYEPGVPVLESGEKVKLKINPERVLLI
ncbi:ABC-type Fe3+/spermidine/putrescine transport system ATPase subunit [Caldalkalibacillus uzonensis]|uniref:ABC-type Fe3+/spermidine/putrescine transport system ATPase subunit n=1 Tax=Caldalkalibacillus uzonensis TaxID=353224 RepID=A0ABU0CVZ1_9BACI|nr:ABC transporter ATP-binding protein [Caldalkalibacillus uzonensis]MDQ0340588.1 ABC-type Fe3+/spermidine/putrescine transport system ATPase subunit [Caldalkalibacillus uzonensis]